MVDLIRLREAPEPNPFPPYLIRRDLRIRYEMPSVSLDRLVFNSSYETFEVQEQWAAFSMSDINALVANLGGVQWAQVYGIGTVMVNVNRVVYAGRAEEYAQEITSGKVKGKIHYGTH